MPFNTDLLEKPIVGKRVAIRGVPIAGSGGFCGVRFIAGNDWPLHIGFHNGTAGKYVRVFVSLTERNTVEPP